MGVRVTVNFLTVLYVIALLLCTAAAALNFATAVIRAKRKRLPRCESCAFCRMIPEKDGRFYNRMERYCLARRGNDELFAPYLSVVTVDDFCSDYRPKPGMEEYHGSGNP